MTSESMADRVLALDLEIREYPILRDEIRKRMRAEMFRRGVIREEVFEEEVRRKAELTQRREGLHDPGSPELDEVWELRCSRVREMLTDFYFAHNLPHSIFHSIVADALGERNKKNLILNFNPETAPWDMLFAQADEFESGDEASRKLTEHHLKEIIVVLTKGMLSDQLGFVGLARQHLQMDDIKEVSHRRIGRGKVGGKVAGLVLARRVLQTPSPDDPFDIGARVRIPESWFLAADVHYEYLEQNNLFAGVNLKYRELDRIREAYDEIRARYEDSTLPESLVKHLDELLDKAGEAPLLVRSSSLLEDNFGSSFAGKYATHLCPNQGSRSERLAQLCSAVRRIYASGLNPDVMAYRKQMGLLDYDERMGVLIQKVEGTVWRDHLFPLISGVAMSHSPYCWNPQLDRRAGMLRLVWGLGSRAVNRVGRDFPRVVALSHPCLQPDRAQRNPTRYSQRFVDTVDLRNNSAATLPVERLVAHDYPALRSIASVWDGTELHAIDTPDPRIPPSDYVVTFDSLVRDDRFIQLMRAILRKLERAWRHPVDIAFSAEVLPGPQPDYRVSLLQCRPQAEVFGALLVPLPDGVPAESVVFSARDTICRGRVPAIRYAVFVDPERYSQLDTLEQRKRVARTIGRINRRLEGSTFILVGPGRWASTDPELGVPVSFADIYKADAIVEVPMSARDEEPEESFGTHFFQDLIESQIYPVAVHPESGDRFDLDFFRASPNALPGLLPEEAGQAEVVRVIDVPASTGGRVIDLTMAEGGPQAVVARLVPAS
ncbi:MAG TPA: PEP/pyruvate-binding domain-containing protein [Polyangiaceae bacterium]|nr:PEP/pyruvate-binding domain-containing protein [Polyangiaceae bacterium]